MEYTLAILAAGLGSRYGGLKQVDYVTEENEAIIDFTIFDAIEAGFNKIVFIIRPEHQKLFEENFAYKIKDKVKVVYAFQELNRVPDPSLIDPERVKPWGTAHALLACKDLIDEAFVICNADDYYGKDAFRKAIDFIKNTSEEGLVAYNLINTISDNGSVTRAFCEIQNENLASIKEIMKIEKKNDQIIYYDEDKEIEAEPKQPVSMNFWIFRKTIFKKIEDLFNAEFSYEVKNNPLKYEALLPSYVGKLIKEGNSFRVLQSKDNWFGITYKEDKPKVISAFEKLRREGFYPKKLW